jgi:HD superfamily phosphohydrolase
MPLDPGAEGDPQLALTTTGSAEADPGAIAPPRKSGGPRANEQQEIFIPVHGAVRLSKAREIRIINHAAFQRLGDIYQLGQAHVVYRGATHRRIEHAFGTLHVAQMMVDALKHNSPGNVPDPDDRIGSWQRGSGLTADEIAFVRLGSLLHDIGHLAAGHTLEDELGLLDSHDRDTRLNLVLDRLSWQGRASAPTLRELIDDLYAEEATHSGLTEKDQTTNDVRPLTATEIFLRLISKDHAKYEPPPGSRFRLKICRDLIGNTICADLLDYLHRDWLHLGKPRYFDQRLLEYMEIRESSKSGKRDSRLVINLRGGNNVRTDAATAIMDLLESRYQLSEIALFHRTKLAAAAMLERAIAEWKDAVPASERSQEHLTLVEELLDRSDPEMLELLASKIDGRLQGNRDKLVASRLEGARALLTSLRLRRLHKQAIAAPEYTLADRASEVQERYSANTDAEDALVEAQRAADNRLRAVRMLETDFGLSPGSIVMYCPPRNMNSKIAKVQVLIHGDVYSLDEFEKRHEDRAITGGHLAAQQLRFRRLWRVFFAIDERERDELKKRDLYEALGRAIELCILRREPPTGTIDEAVRSLAMLLAGRDGSPLTGKQIREQVVAARSDPTLFYPGGAPSLLAFTQD